MSCTFTYDYALGITQQKFDNKILQHLSRYEAKTAEVTPPAETGGASKVRHLHESACREVALSSCYLKNVSKPGLNRASRSLRRQGLHKLIHVFVFVSEQQQQAAAAVQQQTQVVEVQHA